MKRILLVLFVVAFAFVIWNRERLYVRDPLGVVTVEGVKQVGVQVYINYSNDVLLEKDQAPMSLTLVQHGQRVGTPVGLRCLHYWVCRADSAVATLVSAGGKASVESMSSRVVLFRGADGRGVEVRLF